MKRLEGLANGLKTSETLENKKGRNQVFGVGGVHNRYEGEVSHNDAEYEVEVRWQGYNKAGESLTNGLFCSLWAGGSWLVTSHKKDNCGDEWDNLENNENDLVREPFTVLKKKKNITQPTDLTISPQHRAHPPSATNQSEQINSRVHRVAVSQTECKMLERLLWNNGAFPSKPPPVKNVLFIPPVGCLSFAVENDVCAESHTVFTLAAEGVNIISAH